MPTTFPECPSCRRGFRPDSPEIRSGTFFLVEQYSFVQEPLQSAIHPRPEFVGKVERQEDSVAREQGYRILQECPLRFRPDNVILRMTKHDLCA